MKSLLTMIICSLFILCSCGTKMHYIVLNSEEAAIDNNDSGASRETSNRARTDAPSDKVDKVELVDYSFTLNLSVFLSGPYNPSSGSMNDDLRQQNLIPLSEPHSVLGYQYINNEEDQVIEQELLDNNDLESAIVDWIVLEVRDGDDPQRVVYSKAVLITRSGGLVDLNGSSDIKVPLAPGNYRLGLAHRNHLDIVFAESIEFAADTVSIFDLRTQPELILGEHGLITLFDGNFAMSPGDVDWDQIVSYFGSDRQAIRDQVGPIPTNIVSGYYLSEDINMDGNVMFTGRSRGRETIFNDRDLILVFLYNTYGNANDAYSYVLDL